MNTLFSTELLIGTFLGLLVAMVVLLVLQIRTTTQVNRLTFPAYEYVIKKAEHDAQALIQEAQKKAQSIIVSAEQAGQKTIAEYTNQATQIHQEYSDAIQAQTQGVTQALHKNESVQTQAMDSLLASAKSSITEQQNLVIKAAEGVNTALSQTTIETHQKAEEAVSALHDRVEKISDSIELQLKEVTALGTDKITTHLATLQATADEHIAAYEASRIKLLDAHVEQLVESVVGEVLHTQLPVAVHASLAREALEEAKAKNIL